MFGEIVSCSLEPDIAQMFQNTWVSPDEQILQSRSNSRKCSMKDLFPLS